MFTGKVLVQQDFKDAIASMQRDLRNMTGVKDEIERQAGLVDKEQNRDAFATDGASSGDKWADLSPEYAKWKRKAVGKKNILTFSGSMRDASTNLGHPNRKVFMASGVMNLGTDHHLAAKHQYGFRGVEYVKPHHRTLAKQARRKDGRYAKGRARVQVRGYAMRVNLPARPFIRKNAVQVAGLQYAMTRGVLLGMARGTRGAMSRQIRQAAAAMSLRGK